MDVTDKRRSTNGARNGVKVEPVKPAQDPPSEPPLLSRQTIALCLDMWASASVPLVLPDGSTNINGPQQHQQLVTARQELLAALAKIDRDAASAG